MAVDDGAELILKALEKREEAKAYQLYASYYPHMTEESYIPFEEFFKPKKQEENKTEEVILAEVKQILNSYKKGR